MPDLMKRLTMRVVILLLLFFLPLSAEEKKTVCLNMIVKNEKDVITRCLNSVKPIIDYWVIVDTGSTDGTQDIIKACMKGIPGELHERPWKNFAHNRNEALDFARGKSDYVLIMDADDRLEFEPSFSMIPLTCDGYRLKIQYGSTSYYRPQLIKMSTPWKWEGVLHEYLACTNTSTSDVLPGVSYVVSTDGARSKDPQKFQKDAQVLEQALIDEPNNSRYVFYLAQSYRDAGENQKSLEVYRRRIAMGGWEEEVFHSMLQVAHLERDLGYSIDSVISSYYRAHRYRPHRAEPVYFLAQLYRSQGQNALAYALIKSTEFIRKPTNPDVLFVQDWVEDYGLLTELSISAFYAGYYQESLDACNKLLAMKNLPENWRKQTEINRVYALSKLPSQEELAG